MKSSWPQTVAWLQESDGANVDESVYADLLQPINFDALPPGIDYRLADITVSLGRDAGKEAWDLICARPKGTVLEVRNVIYAIGAYWMAFKRASSDPEMWVENKAAWIARYHRADAQAMELLRMAVTMSQAEQERAQRPVDGLAPMLEQAKQMPTRSQIREMQARGNGHAHD